MEPEIARIATLAINPALDIWLEVERLEPVRKLRCQLWRRHPGGGGINVARAIRKLGGSPGCLHAAGGMTGAHLEKLLDEEGIDHVVIPIRGETRESLTVLERTTRREYRFVLPGPKLTIKEWRQALRAVAELSPPPDYLVLSGSLPLGAPDDFYARIAKKARTRGIRCALDTSGPALKAALAIGVFLVKPNQRELEELVGKDLPDQRQAQHEARRLVETGAAEIVALTLGAEGAFLVSRKGELRVRSPKIEPKSSVGAGDSFLGGLVYRLAGGWPLERAFTYAAACGAASLLSEGTELCRPNDVERLYRELRRMQRRP